MSKPTRRTTAAALAKSRAADAKHQADRRARLAEAGRVPITLIVERRVAEILRSLAGEHGKPRHEVFALGVLMARRELEARAARDQAGQEPA